MKGKSFTVKNVYVEGVPCLFLDYTDVDKLAEDLLDVYLVKAKYYSAVEFEEFVIGWASDFMRTLQRQGLDGVVMWDGKDSYNWEFSGDGFAEKIIEVLGVDYIRDRLGL